MNFHETVLGKRFFERQLPQLLSSLKELSASLRSPRPMLQVNTAADTQELLVQLYYTTFDPETAPDPETHAFYNSAIAQMQDEIRAEVSAELWQKIEHTYTIIATRSAAEREQAYVAGFQTAMSMISCALPPSVSVRGNGGV